MRAPLLTAIAAAAILLGACAEDSFTGLAPAQYSGTFALSTVDGKPLPAAVETSWVEGTVVNGNMAIDWDANFWLDISVYRPGEGTTVHQVRGFVIPNATGDSLAYADRDGVIKWAGPRTDSTVAILGVLGMDLVFRRVDDYKWAS